MRKVLKISAFCLVGLIVISTFVSLWRQSQPKPTVYEVVKPQYRNLVSRIVATGILQSRTQVELKPQITGIITELNVIPGQNVKKGDVVARVKVIPDMSQLTAAQNQLESAQIELAQITREARRTQALFDKGVVSREENEQMQNHLEASEDRVEAAKALVEVITQGSSSRAGSVNTTEVHSTMTGVVLNVPVKVGTSVSGSSAFSPGTTIATVADMNDIIFSGNIDETEVAKLKVGMEAELVPGSMPDIRIPAVLEYISPEGIMRDGARKFEIKAEADISDGIEIRSGYSVNGYITLKKEDHVLSVDETCVEFSGDSTFVYKLVSPISKDKAQVWERVPVVLGLSDGMYVAVRKGVTENDCIRGIMK